MPQCQKLGPQVFKYTRLLRTFSKPLQVGTLFLGYSNLFATNMCIKTFVVHLNCMQHFCNLCVCACGTHRCALWRQEINTGIFFIHSAHFLVRSFIRLFIYLSVCLLLGVWMFYLYVHLCNTTFRVWGGQKKASETLELELRTVVSLRVGSRNQTQVALSCWVISHPPTLCFETCISLNLELVI